jgi:CYTH domain-containing protein
MSMHLTKHEFALLSKLPAKILTKTRHSVPPFGIDVFDDLLGGLVLAETEFNSAAEASDLVLPSFIKHEVSDDPRFTGGSSGDGITTGTQGLPRRIWDQTGFSNDKI